jgi:amino acid adenylation domain-containing protein/non-ribosomal peptide synthase protein (TIGR01720 family)
MENVEDVYRLTSVQEGMLIHVLEAPNSSVYVGQVSCRLDLGLSVEHFQKAWDMLFCRHSALRTIFLWEDVDEPLQVVRKRVEVPWRIESTPPVCELNDAEWRETWRKEDRDPSFDLTKAPLARFSLIRDRDGGWLFIGTFHHLILDGWSAAVLLEEVIEIYENIGLGRDSSLVTAPMYGDLVAWMSGRDLSDGAAVWASQLAGWSEPARLKSYGPRSQGYDHCEVVLGTDQVESLAKWGSQNRLTMNTVVSAAWALVLRRLTDRDDIVFGSTVSMRPTEILGVESMVGCCLNTIPVRATFRDEAYVVDWVQEFQDWLLKARSHMEVPLTEIARQCPSIRGGEMFDHVLVFENFPGSNTTAKGSLRMKDVAFVDQSHYEFSLLVASEAGALRFVAHFDSAVHSLAAVQQWLGSLGQTLGEIIRPNLRVGDVETLSESQRRQLEWWSTGPRLSAGPSDVLELIRRQISSTPEAPAVLSASATLSYGELDRLSNLLASRLSQRGAQVGDRIGLCIERSSAMVIGILGILKAGCAYVPIEPDYPAERRNVLCREASVAWVVVAQGALLSDEEFPQVSLDDLEDQDPVPEIPVVPPSDSLAYIIFTSGSTGKPKGVGVTHANLGWSTCARLQHYPAAVERFVLLSPFSFDSSMVGIFWTLVSGGALVLPAPGEEREVGMLGELIEQRNVTHLLATPGLLDIIVDECQPQFLRSLKLMMVAGEACPGSLVERLRSRLPKCELHNEYGPTEATVWSVATRLDERNPGERVPIGRPVPGVRVSICNSRGCLVPPLTAGELVIYGPGVAEGYVNGDSDGNQRFGLSPSDPREPYYKTGDLVAWSEDGELLFLGRLDRQVKIRGYRVELAEIEAALTAQTGVKDAIVMAQEVAGKSSGKIRLVAYVELFAGEALKVVAGIKSRVAEVLPGYMMPSEIHALGEFPRLNNGKTDLRALAEMNIGDWGESDQTEKVPLDEQQAKLAAIWEDILGVEGVKAGDNFFELGGDSLLCIRVASRAREVGFELSPADFASDLTLAELAARGSFAQRNLATEGTKPEELRVETTPFQEWFFERDFARPENWNEALLLSGVAAGDITDWRQIWEDLTGVHRALRVGFRRQDGRWFAEELAEFRPAIDSYVLDVGPEANLDEAIYRVVDHLPPWPSDGSSAWARMIKFEDGKGCCCAVAILAHRLLVDPSSWVILTEDLRRLLTNRQISLPPTSFRAWSEYLTKRGQAGGFSSELNFWQEANERSPLEFPRDFVNTDVLTESGRQHRSLNWSADEVAALETLGESRWRVRLSELLVSVAASVFNGWLCGPSVRVTVESDGRADFLGGYDLSRTVGALTSAYPITIPSMALEDSILFVKKKLRSVSNAGVGYGVLRYLARGATSSPGPSWDEEPEVRFRYFENSIVESSNPEFDRRFRISPEVITLRSQKNAMPYLFELEASRSATGLSLVCHYHRSAYSVETIDSLVTSFLDTLSLLLTYDPSGGETGLVPEDLADSDIDQSDLDVLLGKS